MVQRFESWVWYGGALLAGIAGMVNAVGFLGYTHMAVTHLTGTTTQLGLAFAGGEVRGVGHLASVLLAFTGGAMVSGMIIQHQALRLGRRYGVALLVVSALLAVAALLMRSHNEAASYVASAACGLQNGMASAYSGAVLRTTHLTGMFTDLGTALGHALRGLPVDTLRLRLSTMVISSFLVGGVLGGWLFGLLGGDALLIPATLTALVASIYTAYAHAHRQPQPRA